MKILILVIGAMLSTVAVAQDYGLTVGFHETSASVDSTATGFLNGVAGSVSGKLGFDLGFAASFELVPNVRFRTGLIYDQEQIDYKATSGGTVGINFAYLDVPVNVQYNFNPIFGLYGGMIIGMKASDSVSAPSGVTLVGPNMKSLYPFLDVGVNLTFDDMYGFDIFYMNGLGSVSDNVKNYSTFGLNFVYWL